MRRCEWRQGSKSMSVLTVEIIGAQRTGDGGKESQREDEVESNDLASWQLQGAGDGPREEDDIEVSGAGEDADGYIDPGCAGGQAVVVSGGLVAKVESLPPRVDGAA